MRMERKQVGKYVLLIGEDGSINHVIDMETNLERPSLAIRFYKILEGVKE